MSRLAEIAVINHGYDTLDNRIRRAIDEEVGSDKGSEKLFRTTLARDSQTGTKSWDRYELAKRVFERMKAAGDTQMIDMHQPEKYIVGIIEAAHKWVGCDSKSQQQIRLLLQHEAEHKYLTQTQGNA